VQIQRYNDTAYKTTSAFAFALQLVQRRCSPSSAVAAAMSVHHSGLLLLFASSFQHVAFVCPNQPQCLHLFLLRWGQSFALCPLFPQRLKLNLNSVAARITSSSLLSFVSKSIFPNSRDSKAFHHCLNKVCARDITTSPFEHFHFAVNVC